MHGRFIDLRRADEFGNARVTGVGIVIDQSSNRRVIRILGTQNDRSSLCGWELPLECGSREKADRAGSGICERPDTIN